ncbi:MAG: dockerin type I domain-containing protein [Chthoniobacterales bacterium]
MKYLASRFTVLAATLCVFGSASALHAITPVNVTQHHNNASRDGVYIDPAFSPTNAANLKRDTSFDGTIVGNVYAQPLYVEGGPSGPVVIAVTESNNVYALNATTGAIVWQRNVGAAITSGLPCGNISPIGITSTPVVDVASRALFLDAEVSGSGHQLFSLNVDTGAINAGWPITMNAAVAGFDSSVQSQRAALGLVGSTLYVPYGGRFGDCGSYRGRLVGVPLAGGSIGSWATVSSRAGIWGPGGVASDGTNLYVTTGNGSGSSWSGSEAVIRLQTGPVFSNTTTDFWAPTNWVSLDNGDTDLGGSGPIVLDVPGANPSALLLALGKDHNAYLVNRTSMGGVTTPVAQAVVSTGTIITAGAVYHTPTSAYFTLRPVSGTLNAFKINATSPPTITSGWSVSSSGRTAPFVTTTNGTNNAIVWACGTGAGARLFGYNGDTGAVIYAGGGASDTFTGPRSFNTGIAARGRIYLAGDGKVTAFSVPVITPTSAVSRKTHNSAGDFDVDLLGSNPAVECRLGQGAGADTHQIVVTFGTNITVSGSPQAQVTSGTGNVSSVVVNGSTATITLTGVSNAQRLTVTLSSVNNGTTTADVAIPMSVLAGDVNSDGSTNSGDAIQTRAHAGEGTSTSNFRFDVNTDGNVNSGDAVAVRARSGTSLPPEAPVPGDVEKKVTSR